MKYLFIAAFAVAVPAMAMDNKSTICQHADQQRKIDLVYPEKTELPCEVQYTKSTGMQVLWSATSETGFCESQYQAFVEKQKGWGWNCEELGAIAVESSDDEEPMDDEPADDEEPTEDEPTVEDEPEEESEPQPSAR